MDKKAIITIPDHSPLFDKECVDQKMSGFSISRIINGEPVDIELTLEERYNAYISEEHGFHEEDIETVLTEMLLDDENALNGHTVEEIIGNSDLIEMIVATFAKNRDKYGMEWNAAARDAIETEIRYAEENGLLSVIALEADAVAPLSPADVEKKPSLREQIDAAKRAATAKGKTTGDQRANVTGRKKSEASL